MCENSTLNCKMNWVWLYHDMTICRSKLLKQTMTLDTADDKGLFPDLKKELDFFDVRNTSVTNLTKIMQIQKLQKNRCRVYKTEQCVMSNL